MRRGQRASCSSESEEHQRPWSIDSDDQFTPSGCSSDEDSSVSDAEAMKRSQRFSGSFSFEEDQQLNSKNEGREEEPRTSCPLSVSEVVESELATSCMRAEKREMVCDTNRPRPSLFRPQGLWLAMTRCLSLRWLSTSRQTNRKLVYQVDLDQSEDTQSSVSSDSTRESSGSSICDDKNVSLLRHKEEDVSSRRVKNVPPPRRGISHSSPRLPRTRRASDLVLASMILEREMFLRVELVDSGEAGGDLRYRAEWKLSDRRRELAEGVWLSRSQKVID